MHAQADWATSVTPASALPPLHGAIVHMIGIGGSGMSGAAGLLAELGARVSGSDQNPFEGLGRLVERGIRVSVGHDAAHMPPGVQFVVASAAIPPSNPELQAARSDGLPVLKYAELLGELMRHRRGVAVAGTHGKTTTTAICAHLFRAAGLDPSFVVGARCEQLGGGSGVGQGPHFVVESCEFDRSFLHLRPESAVILNIEPDHLDCFGDLDEIVEAFSQFAANVDPDGVVVCNADDISVQAAASTSAEVWTFGLSDKADWQAVNLRQQSAGYAFDVVFEGAMLLSTRLAIPGVHNVTNSLAAIALAHHAGADPTEIGVALAQFAGVDRRLMPRGDSGGVTIVDDYAHHPTEIRASVRAIRGRYNPSRILTVFQPHQSLRTRRFMDGFAESLCGLEEVIVPDVFGAREDDGAAAQAMARELVLQINVRGGRATYAGGLHEAAKMMKQRLVPGDLALTMGAGDVWKVADELVEQFFRADGDRRGAGADDLVSPRGPGTVPVQTA